MNRFKLIGALLVFVLIAVGLSFLLARVERQSLDTPPLSPETPISEPPESPAPESEEWDLAATKRLSTEKAREIYAKLAEKIENSSSASIRTRYELIDPDKGISFETEIRFDMQKPDRLIRQVIITELEDPKDPNSELIHKPFDAVIRDGSFFRKIEYETRAVYDAVLDVTEENLQSYVGMNKRICSKNLENPIQDLMHQLPLENRLRQVVEALEVKTSQGREHQLLFRITREMAETLIEGEMRFFFPYLSEAVKDLLALRKDVFNASTGDPIRFEYFDHQRRKILVQTFQRLDWNSPIPDDRFELELPEHARVIDTIAKLREKYSRGLRWQDVVENRKKGKMNLEDSIPNN